MPPLLSHARDLITSSDPGLVRGRLALRATLTVAAAAAALFLLASKAHVPSQLAFVGVIVAMMGALTVNDPGRGQQKVTILMLPLPACLALVLVGVTSRWHPGMMIVFLALTFAAVALRRYGPRWTAYGMIAFQAAMVAMLFHAPPDQLLPMAGGVVLACGIIYAVRFWLVPERPEAVLRHRERALRAIIASTLFHAARSLRHGRHVPERLRKDAVALNEAILGLDDSIGRNAHCGEGLKWQAFAREVAVGRILEELGLLLRTEDAAPAARQALITLFLAARAAVRAGPGPAGEKHAAAFQRWARDAEANAVSSGWQRFAHVTEALRDVVTRETSPAIRRETPFAWGDTGVACAAEPAPGAARKARDGSVPGAAAANISPAEGTAPDGNGRADLHSSPSSLGKGEHALASAPGARDGADPARGDHTDPKAVSVLGTTAGNDAASAAGGSAGLAAAGVSPGAKKKSFHALPPAFRQAVQATMATGLAMAAGEALVPQRWTWAAIAAFVVFSGVTRGDIMAKAYHRITGTIVGVPLGIAAAHALGAWRDAELAAIFACIFLGIYLMRVSYAWTTIFFTMMVALLYNMMGALTPQVLAQRIMLTFVGAGCGALAAALVLPAGTRRALRAAMATYLRAYARFMDAFRDVGPADGAGRQAWLQRVRELDRALQALRAAAAPLLGHVMTARIPLTPGVMRDATALAHYAKRIAAHAASGRDAPGDFAACARLAAMARAEADALDAVSDAKGWGAAPIAATRDFPWDVAIAQPSPDDIPGMAMWLARVEVLLTRLGRAWGLA